MWYPQKECPHGNAIAAAVGHAIVTGLGLLHMGVERRVTLLSRSKSRHISRKLVDPAGLGAAIERGAGVPVTVVTLDDMTFEEQARLLRKTRVLVGSHGAGLALCTLMHAGAGVVELTDHPPPFRTRSVANIFKHMAEWSRLAYRPVRGAARPDFGEVAAAVKNLLLVMLEHNSAAMR